MNQDLTTVLNLIAKNNAKRLERQAQEKAWSKVWRKRVNRAFKEKDITLLFHE